MKFSDVPVVYAVGTAYQILFYVPKEAYVWIRVGSCVYEDTVFGNRRSAAGMRRITVPQAALHEAGSYTVCVESIRERKSYWTERLGVAERTYPFIPVPESGDVRAYMIGDAHGDAARAIAAAEAYKGFDFLIVNGDMAECLSAESFAVAHNVAAELTNGARPVVFARGNHENRGPALEQMAQYIPLRDGCSYYTFRLGGVWGVVLDCGEDKPDSHPEYGGYACFHPYRLAQTAFLRDIIAHAETEFDAPGVTHRLVVVHTQFPRRQEPDFDIERELFQTWCDLFGDMKIDLIASAHMHAYQLLLPGDPDLRMKIPCPLLIGTANCKKYIGGTGLCFTPGGITLQYTTSSGQTLQTQQIDK